MRPSDDIIMNSSLFLRYYNVNNKLISFFATGPIGNTYTVFVWPDTQFF